MIFVLLPAYNEDRSLRQLIPDIAATLNPRHIAFTICVVDDGSTDGTPAVLQTLTKETSVHHLRHEKNSGYGAAIRTGAIWIAQQGKPDDIAVMMDADTTHSPSYIPDLIRKLNEGYDVVTASYTMHEGCAYRVPLLRRLLSWGANALLRARFRISGIRTYTNGYRAYRVSALQETYRRYGDQVIELTGFPGGAELFLKTIRSGAKPGEIPFNLYYERRGKGSKINILRTIRGYLELLRVL